MARFRQPGAAAIVFMNTLAVTEARFSARARSARRPCRASAMPRQANTSAAASGMTASKAAMAARWRVASTIRYWAVKLTAAAAAARTHSPAAAWRSHKPERSLDHRGGAGGLPWPSAGATGRDMITRRPDVGRWPVRSWLVPAPGRVTAGIATVMSDRSRGRIGVLVFVAADCGGADADSEQPAGYRFGAGTGDAGEVLAAVVAADPGDENGKDADCRAGKESSDSDKRDGECHCVTRPLLCRSSRMTAARSD